MEEAWGLDLDGKIPDYLEQKKDLIFKSGPFKSLLLLHYGIIFLKGHQLQLYGCMSVLREVYFQKVIWHYPRQIPLLQK